MYPTAEVETERETALVGVGWGMRWGEGGGEVAEFDRRAPTKGRRQSQSDVISPHNLMSSQAPEPLRCHIESVTF